MTRGEGAKPNMNKRQIWLVAVVWLLVFGAVASACGSQADGKPPASSPATGNDRTAPPAGGLAGDVKPEPAGTEGKPEEQRKDLSISSQDDSASGADTAGSRKDVPAEPPSYNVIEPFDTTRPTLMGFSVGDSVEAVVARFGKPSAESSMNDGQHLTVLEYPGFRFGADETGKLVFIEVLTDQVTPGLNQFRIGQTVEEAQKALGPADSLNEYVMIYDFGGVVLKCDLNPNDNTVIAIRLFEA